MSLPLKTKRVGDCLAVVADGKAVLYKRPTTRYRGKLWLVTRLAYSINVKTIPRVPPGGKKAKAGLCCHTCNNFWCVEHKHLYIGSRSSNQKDFYATPRGVERLKELATWMTGRRRSAASIKRTAAWHTGRKRTAETKRRIGAKSAERRHSKISKNKTAATMRKRWAEGAFKNRRKRRT